MWSWRRCSWCRRRGCVSSSRRAWCWSCWGTCCRSPPPRRSVKIWIRSSLCRSCNHSVWYDVLQQNLIVEQIIWHLKTSQPLTSRVASPPKFSNFQLAYVYEIVWIPPLTTIRAGEFTQAWHNWDNLRLLLDLHWTSLEYHLPSSLVVEVVEVARDKDVDVAHDLQHVEGEIQYTWKSSRNQGI